LLSALCYDILKLLAGHSSLSKKNLRKKWKKHKKRTDQKRKKLKGKRSGVEGSC
jgi:hypothetical protein